MISSADFLAKTVLLGIAEASPYLFDLVRADSARAVRVLQCEPERYLPHLIEKTRREAFCRRRANPT